MDGLTNALYPSEQISPQMTIVIKTLRQNLEYVLNASQFKYSNGAIEGINRMIKQIQRTAFGFRNFDHMVYRIYYRQMAQKQPKISSERFDVVLNFFVTLKIELRSYIAPRTTSPY